MFPLNFSHPEIHLEVGEFLIWGCKHEAHTLGTQYLDIFIRGRSDFQSHRFLKKKRQEYRMSKNWRYCIVLIDQPQKNKESVRKFIHVLKTCLSKTKSVRQNICRNQLIWLQKTGFFLSCKKRGILLDCAARIFWERDDLGRFVVKNKGEAQRQKKQTFLCKGNPILTQIHLVRFLQKLCFNFFFGNKTWNSNASSKRSPERKMCFFQRSSPQWISSPPSHPKFTFETLAWPNHSIIQTKCNKQKTKRSIGPGKNSPHRKKLFSLYLEISHLPLLRKFHKGKEGNLNTQGRLGKSNTKKVSNITSPPQEKKRVFRSLILWEKSTSPEFL